MKKNLMLYVFFFLCMSVNVSAQKVFPLTSDNAHWNVFNSGGFPPQPGSTRIYTLVKDTIMCGFSYSKIGGENGYVRTQGNKVYIRNTNNCSKKEYLMYDFGMQVGDSAYCGFDISHGSGPDTTSFKVVNIDTIIQFGRKLKRLKMHFDGYPQMNWIVAIGSDIHPFYPFS